jgi:GAF domain-containing protein
MSEYRQLLELNCQQLALQIEILQLEKKLTKEDLQSLNRENKLDRLIAKRESYKHFEV